MSWKIVILAVAALLFSHGIATAKLTCWNELAGTCSVEQKEYAQILAQSESLLLAAKFDELDKIANRYRTSKAQFINGEWKLSALYDGMSYYMRMAPEESWVRRLEKLKAWVKAKPNSITARVALAECLVGYAFHGRSWKYANEVKEEQWQRFNKRLGEAAEVLDDARKLPEKCPGLLAAYQRIALGEDESDYFNLFSTAIAIEPTYDVYFFRAAWHLLPWWFGEDGDWEEFAQSAADHVGGQDGDILYARIVWFMDRRCPKDVVSQNPRINMDRVKRGVSAMAKTKPSQI